ncbi:hypothetical protein pb186bvf_013345 [Paramecium bursaria]
MPYRSLTDEKQQQKYILYNSQFQRFQNTHLFLNQIHTNFFSFCHKGINDLLIIIIIYFIILKITVQKFLIQLVFFTNLQQIILMSLSLSVERNMFM